MYRIGDQVIYRIMHVTVDSFRYGPNTELSLISTFSQTKTLFNTKKYMVGISMFGIREQEIHVYIYVYFLCYSGEQPWTVLAI